MGTLAMVVAAGARRMRRQYAAPERGRGVTLTELVVTIAIVGILAAIAIPSYKNVVEKARRHDAEDALMGLRQAMERHYARMGNYDGAALAGVPQIYASQTPVEGAGHFYDLRVTDVTEIRYELSAIPVGGQAADECGTLRLNQAGQRGSALVDGQCWNGTMAYPETP